MIDGRHEFRRAERVLIRSGWKLLGDKAEVELPFVPAYLEPKDGSAGIKPGQKIIIEVGYRGYQKERFEGWIVEVEQINHRLILKCDDDFYLLRKVAVRGFFKQANLNRDILPLFTKAGIKVNNPSVKNVEFGSWKYDYSLETVCKRMAKVGVYSYFRNGVLQMGLAYSFPERMGKQLYVSGENVMRWLVSYRTSNDVKMRVKAVGVLRDPNKTLYQEGLAGDPNAPLTKMYFYGISDKAQLEQLADQELKKFKYTGFEGYLRTWAIPNVKHGMTATVNDQDKPEGNGDYYIDMVVTECHPTFCERNVHLGIKLSVDL